jgi:hypothetical protein
MIFYNPKIFVNYEKPRQTRDFLEQVWVFGREFQSEVFVSRARGDAAPGGPLNESQLEKVRLVHIFDGVQFFGSGGGKGLKTDRSAVELYYYRFYKPAVDRLESQMVHFQKIQRFLGDFVCYNAVSLDFGVISDPLQQAIGDSGRVSR